MFARDGWACQYCGARQNLTVDHVIPRSKGGSSDWTNIVASCAPCNRRKGDHLPGQAGDAPALQARGPESQRVHPRREPRRSRSPGASGCRSGPWPTRRSARRSAPAAEQAREVAGAKAPVRPAATAASPSSPATWRGDTAGSRAATRTGSTAACCGAGAGDRPEAAVTAADGAGGGTVGVPGDRRDAACRPPDPPAGGPPPVDAGAVAAAPRPRGARARVPAVRGGAELRPADLIAAVGVLVQVGRHRARAPWRRRPADRCRRCGRRPGSPGGSRRPRPRRGPGPRTGRRPRPRRARWRCVNVV